MGFAEQKKTRKKARPLCNGQQIKRERERERERERDTHTQTDRQTDRHRETERETERERQRERLTLTLTVTLTPFIMKATDPYTRREVGIGEGKMYITLQR